MTRNPKEDAKLLEREYVYSPDNISLTDLAEKYQLARSGVADKAQKGEWYKKRLEYQALVRRSVVEAMGQRWAEQGVALRENVLRAAEATIDAYVKALTDGTIKVDAKDAALMAGVIRTYLGDIEDAAKPSDMVVEGQAVEMNEEKAVEAIAMAKRLLAGGDDASARKLD